MPQCHLPVLPPTVMDVLVTPVLMQCILVVPSPQDTLLKGILQIVEANMDLEPLHFLSFPIVLGAPTAAGASPGPRQNGTAGGGGKGVGLLWKGKLSPRRDGDGEPRSGHLWTSPWHASPLHLPLVGQNCWPHMASGFSASMWLRLTEAEEGEKDKGETNGGFTEFQQG